MSLEEICKGKEEGRLVILPCKVGDTVYIDFESCLRYRFSGWTKAERESYKGCILEDTISGINASIYSNSVHFTVNTQIFCLSFSASNFGKTVFLTREAAGKALGGAEDEESTINNASETR